MIEPSTIPHYLGFRTGEGNAWPYLFWSGIAAFAVYLGALRIVYKKVNCHHDGCRRIGIHHVADTPYIFCAKHHPHVDESQPVTTQTALDHQAVVRADRAAGGGS